MLATSPYLLWEEGHGGAHVRAITASSGVVAHPRMVALLDTFDRGQTLDHARATLATIDPDGTLLAQARALGLVVDNLRAHTEAMFNAFERRIDPERPRLGYIETTNRCPFTCVMCPKSTPAYQRADATMPSALFERIIGQLLYQDEVCLHLFGDPLLDRLIYDRIGLVRQHGLRAVFSTNALMLTPRAARALLDSGLSRLVVSCDAVTDETYRIVRPPGGHPGTARQRLASFVGAS